MGCSAWIPNGRVTEIRTVPWVTLTGDCREVFGYTCAPRLYCCTSYLLVSPLSTFGRVSLGFAEPLWRRLLRAALVVCRYELLVFLPLLGEFDSVADSVEGFGVAVDPEVVAFAVP